jgi:membrane protease YdiL (CAAX protease family)
MTSETLRRRVASATKDRVDPLLLCFVLATLAMLPAQIFRLFQVEALPWLLGDYAGRLLALGVVLTLPAGRWVLAQQGQAPQGKARGGRTEAMLWIVGFLAGFRLTGLDMALGNLFPETRLGDYPAPQGWLYLFDISLGLALVALHEEIVFRKLAHHALSHFLPNALAVTLASATIFAAYHWWTGIGNVITALVFGLVAMPCYRRFGSLWPIGIAHYLVDLWAFA